MKIIGIIPARYKSSRFPGKPMINILGKPLVIHVAEKAEQALGKENVFIATEDQRIYEMVVSFGYNCVMTTDAPLTGTDRLWEVAQQIPADIYINIQGDEPMVNPADIKKIAEEKQKTPNHIINGMCPLSKTEDPADINIPKVLFSSGRNLLYMSRLPIPGIKDVKSGIPIYWKQVCIYAFNYNELKAFGTQNAKAPCERYEDIEILRFLDLGFSIKMIETAPGSLAVDNPEDVLKVENSMRSL